MKQSRSSVYAVSAVVSELTTYETGESPHDLNGRGGMKRYFKRDNFTPLSFLCNRAIDAKLALFTRGIVRVLS